MAKTSTVPGAGLVQATVTTDEETAATHDRLIRTCTQTGHINVRTAPGSADIACVHAVPSAKAPAPAGAFLIPLRLTRRPFGSRAAIWSSVQVRTALASMGTPGSPSTTPSTPRHVGLSKEPSMVGPRPKPTTP